MSWLGNYFFPYCPILDRSRCSFDPGEPQSRVFRCRAARGPRPAKWRKGGLFWWRGFEGQGGRGEAKESGRWVADLRVVAGV